MSYTQQYSSSTNSKENKIDWIKLSNNPKAIKKYQDSL